MTRVQRLSTSTLLLILGVAGGSVRGRTQEIEVPRALDAREPIRYFLAPGGSGTGFRPGDLDLARWALGDWARGAAGALTFVPADESASVVRLYWAGPSSGLFGEMEPLVVAGHVGAAVYIRPDMTALGPDLAREAGRDPLLRDTVVYLTCLHELGHALGLTHTRAFDDIMYFFGYGGDVTAYFSRYRARLQTRADIARTSGLSRTDISRIRALYKGADPIGPTGR